MLFIKSEKNKLKKRVFWWEPKDGLPNAGDHLAKIIVQEMLKLYDKEILDKKTDKNKLLSVGSVMHFAKDNDTIWGTGINGKVSTSQMRFQNLDVRALRGPLTRKLLQDRGIECPEIYGDPAILLPKFFPASLICPNGKKKKFIVIPHMNEDIKKYRDYGNHICSPRQGAISFTKNIVESEFVISSSLHGVIIAEAYGIPAVFLENESGETSLKYDDYYQGTGRDNYPVAKNIDEAFKITPSRIENYESLCIKLLNAFPYDLWLNTERASYHDQ